MPSLTLPSEVGVMILPGTVFFPKVLLPLHIFEPRYRLMLQKSLEDSRIFAVSLATEGMKPHAIGAIGIIRACVDNADESSNLVLQGLTRVRFIEFTQDTPYPMARIEILHSDNPNDIEIDALVNKTLDFVHEYKENGVEMPEWMEDFLKNLNDRDTLVDMVSYGFVSSIAEKQKILETLSLKDRFHRLVHVLQKQPKQ